MRTITLFANKGGSGRTVSTMALASGFLAQGRRVTVMDCSDRLRHFVLGDNKWGRANFANSGWTLSSV